MNIDEKMAWVGIAILYVFLAIWMPFSGYPFTLKDMVLCFGFLTVAAVTLYLPHTFRNRTNENVGESA